MGEERPGIETHCGAAEMTAPRLLLGIALPTSNFGGISGRVRLAERIGLGFVVLDDPLGAPGRGPGLDPIELAAFAGGGTSSIALVAAAATTHAEPFHLSNQFSSLDWGTHGRAGWLASIDSTSTRALAYSARVPDPAFARREATAVIETARRLWDSWEDGALMAEVASGRFLDQNRIHSVNLEQELFAIHGPALMPRPIQGQVVVLARHRDGLTSAEVTLVGGVAEAKQARARGSARVFAEILISPALLTSIRRVAAYVDGIVVHAPDPDSALEDLRLWVVPALSADGTLAIPEPGQTFREQLDLLRPLSRYATGTQPAQEPE
jgi:alkanesulfonate monooxygenase SsuD/methylene tetrahydromethanopterin reductase-like flavin-dependent oxidoreductase (luciferase family)